MSATARAGYFWRSAFLGMRHSPFIHLVAVLTLGIALFTAGLARGGVRLIDGLRASLGGEVEVTVYLDAALPQADGEALAARVAQSTGGEASWVSPDDALSRLGAELGDLSEAVAGLPDNPLPATVELKVPEALRGPDALARLAEGLRAEPGVTAVDYGEAAVARLEAVSRALRLGGAVGFLIIVVATVIITSATLQLAIYARREEIEIQKLVGATDRFVKTPFLIEGLLQGVFGALLAALALFFFAHLAGPKLEGVLGFLMAPGQAAALFDARTVGELFGLGTLLGLCGSFVAVGRFLRV